jgi:methylated-DNA-protein-cysteine methyltransferase-like protein
LENVSFLGLGDDNALETRSISGHAWRPGCCNLGLVAEAAVSYRKIYSVVSRIPRGRVATYGQVARLASFPGQARLVGYALSALEDGSRIPWHRVVNARGAISPRRDGSPMATVQRLRLERERVRFDGQGRVRLEVFRWRPRKF